LSQHPQLQSFNMLSPRTVLLVAASASSLILAGPAAAQRGPGQDRLGEVFGAFFGQTNSLEAQWARGGRPLNGGRAQLEARLSADTGSGAIPVYAANRLRADYEALVDLESRYAADGRFSTEERADLTSRYATFTRSLEQGGPSDNTMAVADGRAEFEARLVAAVNARRITRTQATALRSDYQALLQTESVYARDGISARERSELDTRLDAIDVRLGDAPGRVPEPQNARERLAEVLRTLSAAEQSGALNRREAADLRVQHGDLVRLEMAYARNASNDDRAYLQRRITEIEARMQGGGRRQPND
jgi:hypothetical protein